MPRWASSASSVAVDERQPQVLAAALRGLEGAAAQARLEVGGAQRVSTYRAGVGDGHVGDAAAGDPPLEPRRTTSTSGSSGIV